MVKTKKFNTIVKGLSTIDPYHDFRVAEWSEQSIDEYYSDILVYSDKVDLMELIYAMIDSLYNNKGGEVKHEKY